MATCRYRKGGGGVIMLDKERFTIFGKTFWKFVEYKTNRKIELEEKLDSLLNNAREVTIKHMQEKEDLKKIEDLIKKSRQDDPNISDSFEMALPKDSKRYRKRRNPLKNTYWERLAVLCRQLFKLADNSEFSIGNRQAIESEKVGLRTHEPGIPVDNNQQRQKGGGNQQNNQRQNQQDRW